MAIDRQLLNTIASIRNIVKRDNLVGIVRDSARVALYSTSQISLGKGYPVVGLRKAVIATPKGDDGKFDAGQVPEGASVWITVTTPGSPLYGRPILITKRPDGLFVLTGGAGQSADSRRHMVLTGNPKKTKRDEALEEEIDEAVSFNQPLIQERKKLTATARKEIKEAADNMREALGITASNKKDMLKKRDEIQHYIKGRLGDDDPNGTAAKRMTDAVMRQYNQADGRVAGQIERQRADKLTKIKSRLGLGTRLDDRTSAATDDVGAGDTAIITPEERIGLGEDLPDNVDITENDLDDIATIEQFENDYRAPMEVSLPDIEDLKGLSSTQQEHEIAKHFDNEVEKYFDDDRAVAETSDESIITEDTEQEASWDDKPTLTLGSTVDTLDLKDSKKVDEALEHVKAYYEKRSKIGAVTEMIKKVPLANVTPSTVQRMMSEGLEPMTMEEVAKQVHGDLEAYMRDNNAIAMYDAIGEHWNSDISLAERVINNRKDSAMQFHVNAGASSALTSLGKKHVDKRFDLSKLINDGNIELAAAGLAMEVARKHKSTSAEYEKILTEVREYNSINQKLTETKAMKRHRDLSNEHQTIQVQKGTGELLDKVRISSLEAENLVAQRANLGTAMGSLQASATFYDALEQLKGEKRTPVMTISLGPHEDSLEGVLSKLGVKKDYEVDMSDPENYKLRVNLSSFSKHIREAPDVSAQRNKYEKLKHDMSGVVEDESGHMIVREFKVPKWKDSFDDGDGGKIDYHWRVEQRNDMQWLNEATQKTYENPDGVGGGLITRVTGAGKTNTALGFFAFKQDEDPDYKGMVVVPRGRAAQWVEEANKFTDLKVELIPDGTAKDTVDSILENSEKGTVYVMGHREASRSHEMIGFLQDDEDFRKAGKNFGGLVIDEPQELQSRGQSGNIGALGRRLMKLNFTHRVGLTATPARRNPTDAYDLIKWTQGSSKQLGSKAAFVRTFSGFGSGTNAEDEGLNKTFFDTIAPFISSGRLTDPDFKVNRQNVGVARSDFQRQEQARIEKESATFIETRRKEIMTEARENPRSSMRTGRNWQNTLARRATQKARKDVEAQHQANWDGGDYRTNSKIQAFKKSLEESGDKKHVVYINSKTQRQALSEMFKDMGFTQQQVKNIASSTGSMSGKEMSYRARAFKNDPKAKIIMIDKSSSSGYNLQSGDVLHVLGAPEDGATYLQSQGRVARSPRVGDVDIQTYKYSDNPVEQAHWNDLDTQLKVLRATAPAMFVGYEE